MNFASWSIRNPIPSILLFALLTVAGLRAFTLLAIQDLPDMSLPSVTVTATLPGAAPAQLETEIARPLEDTLSTVDGLRHVTTAITDGSVRIEAAFELDKPLSDALIQAKDAVDGVRSDLPADMLQPTVEAVTFGSAPVLIHAIQSSRLDEAELSWFVDDTLAKAIRSVPGVGRVERLGGVDREARVVVDPVRMAALGVTAADVSRALRQVQQQSSGGRAQLGGAEQSIRTVAVVAQVSDLAALPIVLADGRRVRLDQLATVEDGVAQRTQAAFLDGQPVLGFQVYRARGADETKVAEGVIKVLRQQMRQTPGLSLTSVGGSIDYTLEQYEGSMSMLYEGALLAVVVVWLFLRDWRATLIVATALPLSILPTFAAMALFGYTLNTLTLLALAVVIGILVDDAIVEVENIERHRRMGKPIRQATEDAVTEIAKPVIATTLSLVAVFLPTAMMPGFAGLIFKPFGWTAVIAVLASLLVARLLTPMMAANFLKDDATPEPADGWIMRRYLFAANWCLSHPKITAGATVVFLAASLALLPLIPTGFLPPDNRSVTEASFELPPGGALETAAGVGEEVRRAVAGVEGVRSVFVSIGQAGGGGPGGGDAGEVRRGSATINLAPPGERRSKTQIEAAIGESLKAVPGARFAVGGGGGGRLDLILAGDDPQVLKAVVQRLEREMRGVKGLSNVNSTASLEQPEIVIRPDLQRAAERGVTAEAIGEVVRVATSGDFDAQVARLNFDKRQVFIRTRIADAARRDPATVANLHVAGRDGPVPLGSVADIAFESGPSRIDRYDRKRNITLSADLNGMPLGEAMAKVNALPTLRAPPASVSLSAGGGAEMGEELGVGFVTAMVAGVLCIYGVLVLLFKDFLQPVTILSALPLSLGGAFVALLAAGSSLSMPAMIGLVMLMGVVSKNSILLVEYALVGMKDRGLSRRAALIDACHKRARPIVMTTVAMIAGMAPIALGLGADASFRQPMAIAVIGGLLTSTALSLLVVPVVFLFVDRFERWVRQGRRDPRTRAPQPEHDL